MHLSPPRLSSSSLVTPKHSTMWAHSRHTLSVHGRRTEFTASRCDAACSLRQWLCRLKSPHLYGPLSHSHLCLTVTPPQSQGLSPDRLEGVSQGRRPRLDLRLDPVPHLPLQSTPWSGEGYRGSRWRPAYPYRVLWFQNVRLQHDLVAWHFQASLQ